MLLSRKPDFGRHSVDELGAKFDRMVEYAVVLGEYASADAVASLDDLDAEPGAGEANRGGKAGYAGSEDEDVGHGDWMRIAMIFSHASSGWLSLQSSVNVRLHG